MRTLHLVALLSVCSTAALGQLTLGIGGGAGIGSRGGDARATHADAFVEFKLPVIPGLRADALVVNAPSGAGKVSLALSIVFSAPIPVVTPYVVGGWGNYGIDGDNSRSGWNLGIGGRASLGLMGIGGVSGVFLEVRRHQRVPRDLITLGVRL